MHSLSLLLIIAADCLNQWPCVVIAAKVKYL